MCSFFFAEILCSSDEEEKIVTKQKVIRNKTAPKKYVYYVNFFTYFSQKI